MTPVERITAAVEFNPDRSRVTLSREVARELLADHQRQAADVEFYKAGIARAESMLSEQCTTIERLTRERDGFKHLAEQRRAAAEPLIHPLAHLPHAWVLYGLSAVAAALVGHG